MKAEIITIGDEILLGQTVDTNSAWIAQNLVERQIYVEQITSITDTSAHIVAALTAAAGRSDLIICTGGLGPTNDDITKQTAAYYFQTPLILNEEVMAHVQSIFDRYEKPMPEINRGQAMVLKNAEVLFNEWGTAPGMWVEHQGKVFVFLPGVPFEMKNLMTHRVLPRMNDWRVGGRMAIRYLVVAGIGESYLAEMIADIEQSMPEHIRLAYLPQFGLIKLRLNAAGSAADSLEREVEDWASQLSARIGSAVVATEDVSFQQVIVNAFTKEGCSLSTAESCTGGRLAAEITAIPGASAMFLGGIVAYDNDVKQKFLNVGANTLAKYGAVSGETVEEMAMGAKKVLGTTYAIATSGVAGPTGGTAAKPVGTVWIAVAGEKQVIKRKFQFKDDRVVNIQRTVANALLLLWELFRQERALYPNIISP